MMDKFIPVGAIAIVGFVAISSARAQNPAQTPAPTPQVDAARTQATTKVAGCLYRERDVPGRQPNVVERAGVLEDYILAEMPASTTPAKPGAVGTAGTASATTKMYKVELIPDEKLRALVGKRVEVTGRIDAEGGTTAAKPDRGPGPDTIDLPEFEATDIREVSGSCPASPAPAQ